MRTITIPKTEYDLLMSIPKHNHKAALTKKQLNEWNNYLSSLSLCHTMKSLGGPTRMELKRYENYLKLQGQKYVPDAWDITSSRPNSLPVASSGTETIEIPAAEYEGLLDKYNEYLEMISIVNKTGELYRKYREWKRLKNFIAKEFPEQYRYYCEENMGKKGETGDWV